MDEMKLQARSRLCFTAVLVEAVVLGLGLSGCGDSSPTPDEAMAPANTLNAADTSSAAPTQSGEVLGANGSATAASPAAVPTAEAMLTASPTVVTPSDTALAPSVAPTLTAHDPPPDASGAPGGGGSPGLEPPSPPTDPDTGPDDELAAQACAAMLPAAPPAPVELQNIEAVLDSDDTELAGSTLKVDGSVLYRITLPVGQPSYVRLDEDTWDALVAFHTHAGTSFEVLNAAVSPLSSAPLKNGACPESTLTDYRVQFMHWSTADLRFSADGPRQVDLLVTKMPGVGTPSLP
jgi:hypothetical protein